MSNDRFEAATRNASFVLTLSGNQINWLVCRRKNVELAAKFEWHQPFHEANFGEPDGLASATQMTTPTVRALVKRGLLDVVVTPLPCTSFDVLVPTRAGELVTDLLLEAGFTASPDHVPSVRLHPDDRPKIRAVESADRYGGPNDIAFKTIPSPGDRRLLYADEADLPFLSKPIHGVPVA